MKDQQGHEVIQSFVRYPVGTITNLTREDLVEKIAVSLSGLILDESEVVKITIEIQGEAS